MESPAEKVPTKTSTTGKLNKQASMKLYKINRLGGGSSGFTLMELLVVIVLMGVILVFVIPTTRDVLTGDNLKKASRQLIGIEKQLRVDAVRDQMDYILCLDLPKSAYFVLAADMTPEKQDEIKKRPQHLPSGVVILDIVGENNKKQSEDEVRIKFGKKNTCSPVIIHLAYEENRMTLVINPFLGVTNVYDKYIDIAVTSSGQSTSR
jgi:prepilin-type N-terminal cleavage/methylation domain-containing protein